MFSVPLALALLATTAQGAPVIHPATARTIVDRAAYAPSQLSNSSLLSGVSFNFTDVPEPQPIRGDTGGYNDYQQLEDEPLDQQNPDILAPPDTDAGDVCESLPVVIDAP